MNRLSLQARIGLPVSAFITSVVLGGAITLAVMDSRRVADEIASEAERQSTATLGVLEVIDTLVTEQAVGAMTLLQERAEEIGWPRLEGTVTVGERQVPGLYFDDELQANNFNLVDSVVSTVGGTATLFVKSGDDFVRVSTNVVTNGRRAIGTILDPNGAAIRAIREGRPFFGLVDILGEPYITGYEPLRSVHGETIGVWYVGFKLDMEVLEALIDEMRFLQSGFLALVDRNGRVRFNSEHVQAEQALKLAADPAWVAHRSQFAPWGFEVIAAYPRAEVSAISNARAAAIVVFGLLACALMILLLMWLVRRLVIRPLGGEPAYAAEVAQRIAAGQLAESVNVREGDDHSLLAAMRRARDSVHLMVTDARMLSDAAVAGQLETRADAARHEGEYRQIVEGVNATLDAVIGPLNVAASYVDRISKGNIPEKITQHYNGDFSAIRENLNSCIDAVNALVDDAVMLSHAAVEGRLDTRADAQRHRGDYRRIVEGVNATLDAVIAPVNEVKRVMVSLADGDLTQQVNGAFQGDFEILQQAVNQSLGKLRSLVAGIKDSADTINTASREIAAGNTNLSQRTEEQASSLEETAASMEELTATVRQNADSAHQANQLAHGARDVAARGGERVRQVVTTMGAISESSRKISDIISVIDGIAFQTNILALNAAVEAARAGEQGRGFAVVAGEVRTLAQRSAAAAKEIKNLIEHSVDTVDEGSKLVEQAGGTMEEIVVAVKRVTDIIAEISAASDEQRQGIEQVSTAVAQMDEVTQQNAALVEESAAAASSLEDQAHGLSAAVAVFRIDDTDAKAGSQAGGRTGSPSSTTHGATTRVAAQVA